MVIVLSAPNGASLTAVTVIVVTAVFELICPSLTVTLTIRVVVSGLLLLLAKPICLMAVA